MRIHVSFFLFLFFSLFFLSCQREVDGNIEEQPPLSQGGFRAYVGLDVNIPQPAGYLTVRAKHAGQEHPLDIYNTVSLSNLNFINGLSTIEYTQPLAVKVKRTYYDNAPYINQDIVTLQKSKTLIQFQSSIGYTLTPGGQSNLAYTIPADAFLLKNSTTVYNGLVTVSGYDSNDPNGEKATSSINGINIHIDNAGNKKFLAPRCYSNWQFSGATGEALILRPGKEMELAFFNDVSGNDIYIYYFDDSTGKYKKGQPAVAFGNSRRVVVSSTEKFLVAAAYDLAEVKGKIVGEHSKTLPGLLAIFSFQFNNGCQTSYHFPLDDNGNFHFYLPANINLKREIFSSFQIHSSPENELLQTILSNTFSAGITDLPLITLPRKYRFGLVKGTVVDSFMNTVSTGSMSTSYYNAFPNTYFNLQSGPGSVTYFTNGLYSNNVLIVDTPVQSMAFTYNRANVTIPGNPAIGMSSTQFQDLYPARTTQLLNGGPIIDYYFSPIRKKGIFYINGQRHLVDFEEIYQGSDTIGFRFNCFSFNPNWQYVEILALPVNFITFQGDVRVYGLRFLIDPQIQPIEYWTPVGSAKMVVNAGDPAYIGNYSFPKDWYGIMKGTFRAPSGATQDWKLIFNTGQP